MTNRTKILIGMPTPGMLESETNDSIDLIKMNLMDKGIDALSMKTEGVYVFKQRNIIAQRAIELGCSHVFFVDNDMVLPAEIVTRFLAYDKDIISTNYVIKAKRGKCSFSCTNEDFKTIPLTENDVGLKKVYIAPTGSMLIKTSVFEKVPQPWFWHGKINHKGINDIFGEDSHFCHEANKVGFDVWIDADMSKRIEHIGKKAFNWKDAL